MIVVRLRTAVSGSRPRWRAFRLAGHDVVMDVPISALEAFAVAPGPDPGPQLAPDIVATEGRALFRGPAFVCGSTREVACTLDARGYAITVEGVGRFAVGADGASVTLVASEFDASDPAVAEAALGPALTLALALRGTFCLHASAVRSAAGATLFLGASGAGKSTLAAGISLAGATFTSLTDDITPFVPSPAGIEVRSRFPQLKLGPARQPAGAPEGIPLAAAYLLDLPGEDTDAVAVEPLDAAAGLTALLRHTVAVRLFGRGLLAGYARALAAAPPVRVAHLRYPRRHDAIPEAAAALAADLAAN